RSQQLAASQSLSDAQVSESVESLVNESVPTTAKADFLSGLARKGETVEEIAAFVRALREKSVTPPLDAAWRDSREILDVCGTGGDQLGTFNISTTVALVCAAAGVAVAKHGNRAITSRSGSADVLEARDVRSEKGEERGTAALDELSTLGGNSVAEFYQERGFTASAFDASQLPLQPATLADLLGGDREMNAEIVRAILRGEERGPKRDAV